MTKQLNKATKESGEKSAFVCVSCGHKNIPAATEKTNMPAGAVHDRFTEATKESGEKSAFACVSCGKKQ